MCLDSWQMCIDKMVIGAKGSRPNNSRLTSIIDKSADFSSHVLNLCGKRELGMVLDDYRCRTSFCEVGLKTLTCHS